MVWLWWRGGVQRGVLWQQCGGGGTAVRWRIGIVAVVVAALWWSAAWAGSVVVVVTGGSAVVWWLRGGGEIGQFKLFSYILCVQIRSYVNLYV